MEIKVVTKSDAAMKDRRISIHKAPVHNEIDAVTHKRVEAAMGDLGVKSQNAVSSDMYEALDGMLLNRLTDYRDARLRTRLQRFLKEEEWEELSNLPDEDTAYVYDFVLPLDYKDANLKMVRTKIHQYLVWGGLLDWYHQHGIGYDTALDIRVTDLENEIYSLLFAAGSVKRPLQPFGPAGKIDW